MNVDGVETANDDLLTNTQTPNIPAGMEEDDVMFILFIGQNDYEAVSTSLSLDLHHVH